MPLECSTHAYHRHAAVDLMTEFTICESLASDQSPYRQALGLHGSYGAILGDYLRRAGFLQSGARLMEVGGGYGSLMKGLLEAHGALIDKVLMADLSPGLLRRQRQTLKGFGAKVAFVQGDIHSLMHAVRGVDGVILNEVIGDLDALSGIESAELPPRASRLVVKYDLEIPRGPFTLNVGALELVEALCRRGLPVFLSEHSSDPLIPSDMPYLSRGLAQEAFPREIPLKGHSEYTIRFSHLIKVASSYGRTVRSGSLAELLGIRHAPDYRFIFLAGACSTDRQELIGEILDHIREYRWLLIT